MQSSCGVASAAKQSTAVCRLKVGFVANIVPCGAAAMLRRRTKSSRDGHAPPSRADTTLHSIERVLVETDEPRSFVRASSACRRRGGRAAAVPPFSGPRSRATVADCNPQPHQHRCALQPRGRPRIGPAPGGTTTALTHPAWRATHSHAIPVPGPPAPAPSSHSARCELQQLAVHRLSSHRVCRTLNLEIFFPAANCVKRAAPGDPSEAFTDTNLSPQRWRSHGLFRQPRRFPSCGRPQRGAAPAQHVTVWRSRDSRCWNDNVKSPACG